MSALDEFDHDSWRTALGTGVGYGLILAVMFVLLFLVPYLLFAVLG
jgi:hypothetical protein